MAENANQPVAWREVLIGVGATLLTLIGGAIVFPLTDGYIVQKMGGVADATFEERLHRIVTEPKNAGLLAELRGSIEAELRPGAVIASTIECEKLGAGWTRFNQADGRFIIGVGSGRNDLDEPVTFEVNDKGGKYTHLLTVDEMPNHNHDFKGTDIDTGGWGGQDNRKPVGIGDAAKQGHYTPQGTITYSGGGKAHSIMPPYVALYVCQRTP